MLVSRWIIRSTWLPVAAMLLASCAGTPLTRQDTAERASYMAHAGLPVDRFTWVSSYRRETPLSSDQVLVWTRLDQAYLVTVLHPCTDLWFANHIAFTQTGDSVYARLNLLKADGWTCGIKTIQPVDYRAVEQDLGRQARTPNQPGSGLSAQR